MHKLFIIPSTNPVLIGLYNENCKLLEKYELAGQISESLASFWAEISTRYEIGEILFVRGPGSFMGLKLCYIFAQTIAAAAGINLRAAAGFFFNENSPISAYGNCYFVADSIESNIDFNVDSIQLKNFEIPPKISPYKLPEILDLSIFSSDLEPLYILPPC